MDELIEMRTFFDNIALDYDKKIADKADADLESKTIAASFIPGNAESLIDFGVGTGMELEAVFSRIPDIKVTGLDISENMLKMLKDKYFGYNVRLLCESYLDYDFEREKYDAALSVKSFHHYGHDEKTMLYKKIYTCLNDGGVYIECDKMVLEQSEEDYIFAEYERLKQFRGIYDGEAHHFDTPCTVSNQIKMLRTAGFSHVREVWRKDSERGLIIILTAEKRSE